MGGPNLNALNNIVRMGWVSSVNVEERTARVIFKDKGGTMVSGDLKILANQPLITIEELVNGEKWNYNAQYSSADRSLGLGESYMTDAPGAPDTITVDKSIEYKCPAHGTDETKYHKCIVKVYPWIPYKGQFVLCIYLPQNDGDGFVIGGI